MSLEYLIHVPPSTTGHVIYSHDRIALHKGFLDHILTVNSVEGMATRKGSLISGSHTCREHLRRHVSSECTHLKLQPARTCRYLIQRQVAGRLCYPQTGTARCSAGIGGETSDSQRGVVSSVHPNVAEETADGEEQVPQFTDVIHWFSASLILLIALADGPLPQLVLPPSAALLILAAVQWGLFVIPTVSYCLQSGYDLTATFLLRRSRIRDIVAGVVGGVSLWVLLTAVIWQRLWTFSAALPAPLPNKSVLVSMFQQYPSTMGGWLFLIAADAIAPALAEELLFRGFLLTCVKPHLGRLDAILLAGALCGMFHLNLPQFFATTVLGIGAGALAITSQSILPAIVLHATHNVAALVYGGMTHAGATLDSTCGPLVQLPPSMVALAALGIAASVFLVAPAWKNGRQHYWDGTSKAPT
eukprot:TRINITY_DN1607_c0_g5_i1.p1 TRINITY_DN1607_c0_g5~~TRINITY_DN1607_c0_g5_i1.p1  ORF type:complete len:416 (-),score=31.49 TRINITY_DN1607_c0_g5_i1:403-1650(-)